MFLSTEGIRSGPPDILEAVLKGRHVQQNSYWFHLKVTMETGHSKYKWINRRLIVAKAQRIGSQVGYDAYYLENNLE